MIDWQKMLTIHQELNQFARVMLTKNQKQFLTASERELLAWIYLHKHDCTPLFLSEVSGMKKEAVSRSLKGLYEKGCIRRERKPSDERSYALSLTETGEKALKNDYQIMLQKFYDLYREMGTEFEELSGLISKANQIMAQRRKNEIL